MVKSFLLILLCLQSLLVPWVIGSSPFNSEQHIIKPSSSSKKERKHLYPLLNNANNNVFQGRQLSDFDELNNILKQMEIKTYGDTFTIKDYTPPISDLTITVSDMTCVNIQIKNLLHDFAVDSTRRIGKHNFWARNLNASCKLSYKIERWSLTLSQGDATLKISDTNAKLVVDMKSSDFSTSPPIKAEGEECNLDVNIDKLELQGGAPITDAVLNLFISVLEGFVTNRFQDDFCCEMYQYLEKNVTNSLRTFNANISPFINGDYDMDDVDSYESQINLEMSNGFDTSHFLNFLDDDESVYSRFYKNVSIALNRRFGGENLGPNDGINEYVRENVVDENGNYKIERRDILSYDPNGRIYQAKNGTLNAEFFLNHVAITGLDTFSSMDLLEAVSPQMVKSRFKLRKLGMESSVDIKLKSTDKDTDSTTELKFSEDQDIDDVRMDTSFSNVDVDVTILAAINLDELGEEAKLNQMLDIRCATPFIEAVEIAQLDFVTSGYSYPTFDNILGSTSFDDFTNSVVESQLKMYESVVFERATSNYIATKMRDDLNKQLKDNLSLTSNKNCEAPSGIQGETYLDLRDLLLSQEEAEEYGGTGELPYGNTFSVALAGFESSYLVGTQNNEDIPVVNPFLIAPFTKVLSGETGTLSLMLTLQQAFELISSSEEEDISLSNPWAEFFSQVCTSDVMVLDSEYNLFVELSKLNIENLDSFGLPIELLKPKQGEKYIVENEFKIGAIDNLPIRLVSEVAISFNSTDSSSSSSLLLSDALEAFSRNKLEIAVEIKDLSLKADLMAKIEEDGFLNFPLSEITNPYCMVSLIPVPELEKDSFITSSSPTASLNMRELLVAGSSDLTMKCVSCSSNTLEEELPKLLKILKNEKSIKLLFDEMISFASYLLNSQYSQSAINRILVESHERCEGKSGFITPETLGLNDMKCGEISVPMIDDMNSLESLIYAIALGVQVGIVILPLSMTENLDTSYTANSLDEKSYYESFLTKEKEWHRGDDNLEGILDFSGNSSSILGKSTNNILEAITFIFGTGLASVEGLEDVIGDVMSAESLLSGNNQSDSGSNIDAIQELNGTSLKNDLIVNFIMNGLLEGSDGGGSLPIELPPDSYTFDLQLSELSSPQDSMKIRMNSINLKGLNSYSAFEPFVILGSQTFLSKFALNEIEIETDVSVHINDKKDNFVVTLTLEDLILDVGIFLALDSEIMEGITLGPLLNSETILDCIVPAIIDAEITHTRLHVGKMKKMELGGGLIKSPVIKKSVQDSFEAIMYEYETRVQDAFRILTETILQNDINRYFQDVLLHELREKVVENNCVEFSTMVSADGYVDWNEMFQEYDEGSPNRKYAYGDIQPMIRSFFTENFEALSASGENKGRPVLNNFLPPTYSVEGTVFYYKSEFNESVSSKSNYFMESRITNFQAKNLNSIGTPIALLRPDESNPHLIKNSLVLGTDAKPFQLKFRLDLGIFDGGSKDQTSEERRLDEEENDIDQSTDFEDVRAVIDFELDLTDARFDIDLIVKSNETDVMRLSLVESLHPLCWLATVPLPTNKDDPTLYASRFNINYSKMNIRANCVDCSGPQLAFLDTTLSRTDVQTQLNEKAKAILEQLNPSFDKAATLVLNMLVSAAQPVCALGTGNVDGLDFSKIDFGAIDISNLDLSNPDALDLSTLDPSAVDFERLITSLMATNPIQLPNIDLLNDSVAYFVGLASFFVIFLLVSTYGYNAYKQRVKKNRVGTLIELPEEELLSLYMNQMVKDAKIKKLNDSTDSMLMSEDVVFSRRYGIVITLGINACIFLAAHIGPCASGDIKGVIAGQEFFIADWLEYSIGQTIMDSYNNGARFVAFIVFFTSLVWPYFKIVISALCWTTPPSYLSVDKRGEIFHLLNRLNKWSMVDVFAFFLCKLLFDQNFISPGLDVFGNEAGVFYEINIQYNTLWGLYANMVAQIMMQITSQIIILYHEQYIEEEMNRINENLFALLEGNNIEEDIVAAINVSSEENIFDDNEEEEKKDEETNASTKKQENNFDSEESVATPSGKDIIVDKKRDKAGEEEIIQDIENNGTSMSSRSITFEPEEKAKQEVGETHSTTSSSVLLGSSRKGSTEDTTDDNDESSESTGGEEDSGLNKTSQSVFTYDADTIVSCKDVLVKPPSQHTFKIRGGQFGMGGKANSKASLYIYGSCVLGAFAVLMGCILPSVSLEVFGILSYAVMAGKDIDSTKISYNLFRFAKDMVVTGGNHTNSDLFWLGLCSLVLISTVLLVPILQLLLVLGLWSTPMKRKHRDYAVEFLDFCISWQYIEVFILTCLLFMWQGDEFVTFGIDVYCEQLRKFLLPLAVYADILEQNDARCFVTNISLGSGIFVFAIASAIMHTVTLFVKKALKQQDDDLKERGEGGFLNENHINSIIAAQGVDDTAIEEILPKIQNIALTCTDSFPFLFNTEKCEFITNPQMRMLMERREKSVAESEVDSIYTGMIPEEDEEDYSSDENDDSTIDSYLTEDRSATQKKTLV